MFQKGVDGKVDKHKEGDKHKYIFGNTYLKQSNIQKKAICGNRYQTATVDHCPMEAGCRLLDIGR